MLRTGDLVKFKNILRPEEETLRMRVLEDEDGGSVLVESLVGMSINPTSRFNTEDLALCAS